MSDEIITCAGEGCSNTMVWNGRGRRLKWCSARCRKGSYGDPCVGCGARTNFGAEHARVPEPRCPACAVESRTIWTREAVVARVREWAVLYGEPPAVPDWSPHLARSMGDPGRAARFVRANGHWPHHTTVFKVFGNGGWNKALVAAGFAPRAPVGTVENIARRRDQRAKAAA